MAVRIRPMTAEEFAIFCRWSVNSQAADLMNQLGISREKAVESAAKELKQMLP